MNHGYIVHQISNEINKHLIKITLYTYVELIEPFAGSRV